MQLIDKIKETSRLVNLSTEASDIKKRSNDLKKLNQYLKTKIKLINDYKESIINLNNIDSEKFPLSDLSDYIGRINKINNDNKRGIPISQNNFKGFIGGLEGKSEDLKKQWNDYVINKTSQLINTLECFKSLFENKEEIMIVINNMERMKIKWPVTKEIVTQLDNLIISGYDFIKKLEVTDDIQDFIKMVVLGTATIEDLTPEILEWINRKQFKDKLFISFK